MSTNPSTPTRPARPTPPVSPLVGSEWLGARASLAGRRIRRFARVWSLVFGPLALAAVVIPLATYDPVATDRTERERLRADTVSTARRLARAEAAVVEAESLVVTATSTQRTTARNAPRQATTPREIDDPLIASLEAAIREARRLRTPSAWLAVAAERPVSSGPRMRALADSLAEYARRRDALPSGPLREQRAAPLSATINRIGYTILAIAENRHEDMVEEFLASAPPAATAEPAAPDGAPADTAALGAAFRAAQDTANTARTAHAGAVAALEAFEESGVSSGPPLLVTLTPGLILLGVLAGGIAVRFSTALNGEIKRPTLSTALEAERSIGATVLATVKHAPDDGPARFRPSGVDPFRMLYLGLTSTGTRARTTIITGSDPEIVAAVSARLAISAAADHRTTLIAGFDPGNIALARTFRGRPEPGLTDALAGSFKWREVAFAVGSSDGLPITMIPAGTERDDLPVGDLLVERREDLTKFRSSFELTILAVPAPYLDLAIALVESSPIVLCASIGETTVDAFTAEGAALKSAGRRLHGTVLWDAPRPTLPTRAQLAALVSKQKGRTPGGSFAAVQRAISGNPKRH